MGEGSGLGFGVEPVRWVLGVLPFICRDLSFGFCNHFTMFVDGDDGNCDYVEWGDENQWDEESSCKEGSSSCTEDTKDDVDYSVECYQTKNVWSDWGLGFFVALQSVHVFSLPGLGGFVVQMLSVWGFDDILDENLG